MGLLQAIALFQKTYLKSVLATVCLTSGMLCATGSGRLGGPLPSPTGFQLPPMASSEAPLANPNFSFFGSRPGPTVTPVNAFAQAGPTPRTALEQLCLDTLRRAALAAPDQQEALLDCQLRVLNMMGPVWNELKELKTALAMENTAEEVAWLGTLEFSLRTRWERLVDTLDRGNIEQTEYLLSDLRVWLGV